MHKVLIVGLGQIGMGYDIESDPKTRIATLARAFNEHPEFALAGGVDLDSARRRLFEDHYACPSFSNLEDGIKKTRPDVIAIAVQTEFHWHVLSQVLQIVTPKAILCEKPLSYNLEEATAMVNLSAESGVALFTNYMRRCDSAVIEIRQRLMNGKISGPIKGICWYSKGLFNNGSHFVNLCQFWLGEARCFHIIDKGRLWADHDPEPDFKIEFETGDVYFLAAREEDFSHYTLELVASNGRLRYERGIVEWQATVPDADNQGYVVLNSNPERIDSDIPQLQWHVANQMAHHLSGKDASICTGLQGLDTLKIIHEIREIL